MVPYGSDRSRMVAGKVILHSAIPKGWTARVPKRGTHSEFPGTTVLWGEAYFEVLEATPTEGGGVRYVLVPWRDELTIRVFEHYDEASEARRIADHELAKRQRRMSVGARLASMFLGHLPEKIQNRIGNELGVSPARMTLASLILPLLFLAVCVWLYVSAVLRKQPSPVPALVGMLAVAMVLESVLRFLVVMTQSRAIGSVLGFIGYSIYWLLSPNRAKLIGPFQEEKGMKVVISDAPPDVALRDSVEMRSPLMTLLTPAEQSRLAERYGFDYRKHAQGVAWAILACASLGVVSSLVSLLEERRLTALISMAIAAAIVLEQAARLAALRRGPAGSFLGRLVRPFLRDLLERG